MSYLKHKPGSIEELMANEASKLNDNAYQDMFKKELEKAGKGIGSMTPKEKKDFFNKIDDKYKAKNENIKEGRYEVTGTVTYQGVSGEDEVTVVVDAMDKMDAEDVADDMIDDLRSKKKIGPKRGGQVKAFYPFDVEYTRKKEGLVDKMMEKVDEPYAVGMAQAMKSTGDKPPLKKSTITKAHDIAKSIEKDEKNEEKDVPKGYHKMPDGTVMKDSEHKKETHTFMTKDMNKSKKDAKGEKEIVDPEPKMKQESMLDAVKNVWQMSAEELEKIKNEAKYMKAQRMSQYKAEDEKNK